MFTVHDAYVRSAGATAGCLDSPFTNLMSEAWS